MRPAKVLPKASPMATLNVTTRTSVARAGVTLPNTSAAARHTSARRTRRTRGARTIHRVYHPYAPIACARGKKLRRIERRAERCVREDHVFGCLDELDEHAFAALRRALRAFRVNEAHVVTGSATPDAARS